MTDPALLRHPRLRGPSTTGGVARVGLGFGGDYNPEQWDERTWADDVERMREAGVTFATVGVFAWARLEPSRDSWDLGWLDRVLDLLDRHDIGVDLATATASPPAWLVREHPEILPVDREGHRLGFGSRQSWCPSSPVFRERSLRLVETLATRYAGHPALALWHVSNELGCHNALCYCSVSAAAFRRWLEQRYGDVGKLNDAWGTAFWSQGYASWDEVEPPRISTAQLNPTQQLDFRRFSSDELLGQHRAERDVLRRLTPEVPVTTNFMVTAHIDGMDYWRWAPEQDVVSNDHYLDGSLAEPHVELSLCADWTRGAAGGRPWVLMEHSTSAVNWQPRNYPKRAGQMRRNALQHVARGADSVGFFQWRASRAGAEKYHSAMLPHAGTSTRVWREVVELGETLARLDEVAGTTPVAEVAMVLDYESWWAVERDSLPVSYLGYAEHVRWLYEPLWRAGVTVDVRRSTDDLSAYRLVVAPLLHLVDDAAVANLTDRVRSGGHLLLTYFSGIVDENDHIRLGGYPGAFRDLLGVRVEEFLPLHPTTTLRLDGQVSGSTGSWAEDLQLAGAEAVAGYVDGPVPGAPAVTRNESGDGVAWYLATRTDADTTARVLDVVLAGAGVEASGLPQGVEVVRRVGEGRSYAFVLNHTDDPVELQLTGHELVADQECAGSLTVVAGGVACVRETVV